MRDLRLARARHLAVAPQRAGFVLHDFLRAFAGRSSARPPPRLPAVSMNPCPTCHGEKHIMCWSICTRCGGSGSDAPNALRAQIDQIDKTVFTGGDGSKYEFERIESAAKK